MEADKYIKHGYSNRKAYLNSLADDYGIPRTVVYAMAEALGPSEDFDGLVSAMEDTADTFADDDMEVIDWE